MTGTEFVRCAYTDSKECLKQRKHMNCWLWIILLLCCSNNNCGSECNMGWNRGCKRRCNLNCETDCNPNCEAIWRGNSCRPSCERAQENTCERNCERNCDCVSPAQEEECTRETNHDHTGCDMTYETFGCQENGIPCPPPVPPHYLR